MNPKSILRYTLVLLMLAGIGYIGLSEWMADAPASESVANADGTLPVMIVYYLSVGKDCTTCENLERYTREALDTHFAVDMEDGTIGWRSYDMELPEYAHFATDFELYTKSIVLVAIEDGALGRWKNLNGVWDHVYDKDKFIEYIREETQTFLNEAA